MHKVFAPAFIKVETFRGNNQPVRYKNDIVVILRMHVKLPCNGHFIFCRSESSYVN